MSFRISNALVWVGGFVLIAQFAATAKSAVVSRDTSAGQGGSDIFVWQNTPSTPRPNDPLAVVDATNATAAARSLVRFDLSSIAGGYVSIDSIQLTFKVNYASYNGGQPILSAHRATSSWSDLTASWNERSTGSAWGTAGGDFDATVLGTQSLSSLSSGSTVTLDILAGVGNAAARKALVDQWTTGNNFGLLLKAADEVSPAAAIGLDNSSSAGRPVITINYSIPEPASVSLLALFTASMALRRRPLN